MKNKTLKLSETHPLTWRISYSKKTVWIKEYQNKNGYYGASLALNNFNQNDLISLVYDSGLKGRGGAGFLTGIKWRLMSKEKSIQPNIRYLLCNADEMEPGTFKDIFLMNHLPHLLIEGMIIAGYALNVHRAYIFLRYEYIETEKILIHAIKEAQNKNFLGKNIFNTTFNFEIIIHTGAGRYICGEETALINSLEGKRAIPRFKPPFPGIIGLWGKPTCVNNVETLCNLPAILTNGVSWYKSLNNNKSKDNGTKLMGFSGNVKTPGVWEVPFGITAYELLENYAHGMKSGFTLKAWLPGGISTSFLLPEHLNTPMDFENLDKKESRLGTALSIAIDDKINIPSLLYNIEMFFSRESCGWCTPCREGLPWSVKILKNLKENKGHIEDIEILEELCQILKSGNTFCAHAPGAISPLKSAIKYFRNEFINGITLTKNDHIKSLTNK